MDVPLILLVFSLAVFGVLAVCVATYTVDSAPTGSLLNRIVESSYAVKQCVFLALGPVVLSVLLLIPYDFLRRYTPIFYWGGTIFLTLVWVLNRAEGVKAWLDIIWGMTLQPS